MISPEDRARLESLAAFLPIFEAQGFVAGRTVDPPDPAPNVLAMPFTGYEE